MYCETTRRRVVRAAFGYLFVGLLVLGCDEIVRPRAPLRVVDVRALADSSLTGAAGQLLSDPVTIRAEDANGEPVAGAIVKWTTTNVGAAVIAQGSTTGKDGIASVRWRLGTKATEPQRLDVTIISLDGRQAAYQFSARAHPAALVALRIPIDSAVLKVGDTTTITFTARDQFGNVFVPDSVKLESRDTTIAKVLDRTRVAVVGRGVAQVIGRSGAAIDSVTLTASQVVRAIIIDPDTVRFHSLTAERTVSVRLVDDRGQDVRDSVPLLRISDTTVVQLLDTMPLVVRSSATGVTRIRLNAGVVQRDLVVEVGQATAIVDVAPLSLRFGSLGDTARLRARVLDSTSTVIPSASVSFASRDPDIATVDAGGLVTAHANGVTRVAVTSSDVTDSITVRVAQRPARLEMARDTVVLDALDAVTSVPVRIVDSLGSPIAGMQPTVTSDAPGVVSVAPDGSVRAIGVGTTTLRVNMPTDSNHLTAIVWQRPAQIALASDSVTLSAFGEQPVGTISVLDSLGSPIPGAVVRLSTSDSAIVSVHGDTLIAHQNGTATLRASSGLLEKPIHVLVAQLARRIEATRLDSAAIAMVRVGDTLAVKCTAFDKNGFVMARAPQVIASAASVVDGASCNTLTARHSGIDTLRVVLDQASAGVEVAVAIRPHANASRASLLDVEGIAPGHYPWAPTLRRTADGKLELYAAIYDSLTWLSGDLHRFVSSDGVHFQHDQLVIAHDTTRCRERSSGIENVAVLPRSDGAGTRLLFAAGSFECYGWQVFSAVSSDDRSWSIEPGTRLSNGGTLPPDAPVYAPWPVGEGMDVERLDDGEWQMLVGGYEHVSPYVDKFQIVEWRSNDQIDWTYRGPVLTTDQMPPGGQSTVYSPSVRQFAPGLYRMVFAGDNRGVSGSRGRIWTAVSRDRIHWQFEGELLGDESVSYYYASLVDDRLITIMLPAGAPLPQGHLVTVTVVMP